MSKKRTPLQGRKKKLTHLNYNLLDSISQSKKIIPQEGKNMKSTGIVRKLDDLGRVVIPVELRRNLDIAEKDALEIFVDGDRIILRKYVPACACVFCGNGDDLVQFRGKNVCKQCISEVS